MSAPPDFRAQQRAFAAHLRDPAKVPAPTDVEDRRMAIYRGLVLNNLSGLLAGSFPVVHRLLEGTAWQALMRDFLVRHRARTPLFLELAEEFLTFLAEQRADDPRDPPFLRELAHYEWVELALQTRDAPPVTEPFDPAGDLLAGHPVLAPLVWRLSYRYPVHRIGPDFQPTTPPATPTHLLVYRNAADAVRFIEINQVTQRLLGLLEADPHLSGRAALAQIAAELAHPQPDQVLAFGAALLADLRQQGVLLGAGPTAPDRADSAAPPGDEQGRAAEEERAAE